MFKFSEKTYETIYGGFQRIDRTEVSHSATGNEPKEPAWRVWAPALLFAVIAALLIV